MNPRGEVPADTSPDGHDETPTLDDHERIKGARRQLPVPPEEEEDGVPQEETEAGVAQHPPQYAELDFPERRPVPAPLSEMFFVQYTEVSKA